MSKFFIRIDFATVTDRALRRRAKLALVTEFRWTARGPAGFTYAGIDRLVAARSFAEMREVIRAAKRGESLTD